MGVGFSADLPDLGPFELGEKSLGVGKVGRHPVIPSLVVSVELACHQLRIAENHYGSSFQDFGTVKSGNERFILGLVIKCLETECQSLFDDEAFWGLEDYASASSFGC
ncbi:hypothetical protein AAC387_Pa06g0587 [Persea americana]